MTVLLALMVNLSMQALQEHTLLICTSCHVNILGIFQEVFIHLYKRGLGSDLINILVKAFDLTCGIYFG